MSFNKYRLKGAYHYDWYKTEPWYKEMVDEVVAFCNGSTLDVGGGDGVVASKIMEQGYYSCVLDNDRDASYILTQRNIDFEWCDLDASPVEPEWKFDFKDKSFDYVACLNVIEHLKRPDGLLELVRHYPRKGAIITTLEWQGGTFGEDHKHEYTLDELTEFFKEFNPQPFRFSDPKWIGVRIKL